MSDKNHFTFRIEGMTCDGCARHVTEALRGVSGVEEAQVPGWQSGNALVLALDRVSDGDLVKAVRKSGYNAVLEARRSVEGERRAPAMAKADYDLMIIGGGSAAFAAAIKGAELGAKVAIAEQGTIGGTCVNIGCVPSKTLIKAAELCFKSAYPRFEGLTACPPPSDWQRVVGQKNKLVAALREGKYVHEGLPRIAPAEEPEIGEALAHYLGQERMTVHSALKIHKVDKSNGEYRVECEIDGRRESVAAEQLLVATGHRANTAGLGLDAAGVATGRKGEIVVDKTLRTANEDVAEGLKLAALTFNKEVAKLACCAT